MTTTLTIEQLQQDHDWGEAFGYAGEPEHSGFSLPSACVGSSANETPILRTDVLRVIAVSEGKHDEENWLIIVETTDGRFAYLEAGCDYTGWDCQAGGHCMVASTLEELIQFGLTDEARDRLLIYPA